MKKRKDHFMPVSLLQSQFEALEMPADAILADINESPDAIVADIVRQLKGRVVN
jgi:gluconokinase